MTTLATRRNSCPPTAISGRADTSPDTSQIPSDTWIRTTVDGYFGAGETIFNFVTGQAVTSPYFKRTS